jgi:hypothetical protein
MGIPGFMGMLWFMGILGFMGMLRFVGILGFTQDGYASVQAPFAI